MFATLSFQVCKTIHTHIIVKLLKTEVHPPSLPPSLDVKAAREIRQSSWRMEEEE